MHPCTPVPEDRELPVNKTPDYEPEEYPRCLKCGRLAMHSRAILCCVCLTNETLKNPLPTPPQDKTPIKARET